jgi:hypothetical protein
MLLSLLMPCCLGKMPAPADASWRIGEIKALVELSEPGALHESLSRCQDRCRGQRHACEQVERQWLCVVRCDGDYDCPTPKKCLNCDDIDGCSLRIYGRPSTKTPLAHVCVLDKFGLSSPDIQTLIRWDRAEQRKIQEFMRRNKAQQKQ